MLGGIGRLLKGAAVEAMPLSKNAPLGGAMAVPNRTAIRAQEAANRRAIKGARARAGANRPESLGRANYGRPGGPRGSGMPMTYRTPTPAPVHVPGAGSVTASAAVAGGGTGTRTVSQAAYDAAARMAAGTGPQAEVAARKLASMRVGGGIGVGVPMGQTAIGGPTGKMPGFFSHLPSTLKGGAAAAGRGVSNIRSKLGGFGRGARRGSQNMPVTSSAPSARALSGSQNSPLAIGPGRVRGRGNPNPIPASKGPIPMGGSGTGKTASKNVSAGNQPRRFRDMNPRTRRMLMIGGAAAVGVTAASNRRGQGTSSGRQSMTRY